MRLMDPVRYESFKASGRLPSPKGVALAVIGLLRRDDYQLSELARLLQSDPAATGRLLKFANAAVMGNTRPVVAVGQAVQMLGVHRVRDLVLAFSILQGNRNCVCKIGGCNEFDWQVFWSRSLATAIAAEAMAQHAHVAAEDSFTLGLLCDVGRLALVAYDCTRYCEALRSAAARCLPLVEVERTLIGADHRELGAALLADWGLPETLAVAAYYSEEPDSGGFADGSRTHVLILSLHFARALAEVCIASEAERWTMLSDLYAKASRLGIAPDELTAIADDVVRRWQDWGAALEVQTHGVPPFAELLASAPPEQQPGNDTAADRRAVLIGSEMAEASRLGTVLATIGYDVRWVANAADALVVALHNIPEVIFVDANAAGLDIGEFCQSFRAAPRSRETYVMLVGAAGDEERLGRLVAAGADDFLIRPINEAALRARMRTVSKIGQLREAIHRERRGLMRSANTWAGSQRRLIEVALTDPLTHLPNRRRGLDFLAAECTFARDHDLPLSCLMIDIDHFKAVNDRCGHAVGDAVLAATAQVLADCCRSEDKPFRYGGEEFCVVCTNTDRDIARGIAERIRSGIEQACQDCVGADRAITVSIGIATLSPQQNDVDALLKAADAALYRAKENGRNRVEG